MKIDFSAEMKNLDGEPILEASQTSGGEKGPLTLKSLAVNALLADEKDLSGEDKFKRYNIAIKINESEKEADLEVEEVALVKKLIGKIYIPLLVGQAWNMLEGKG